MTWVYKYLFKYTLYWLDFLFSGDVPIYLQGTVLSQTMVTGPSLTKATSIIAPNSPSLTFSWPNPALNCSNNLLYNSTAWWPLAARWKSGLVPFLTVRIQCKLTHRQYFTLDVNDRLCPWLAIPLGGSLRGSDNFFKHTEG